MMYLLLAGHRVSIWDDEEVLKIDTANGYTAP